MITLHHIEHSGATNDTEAVFVERALRVGFRNIPGLCGYTYMNGTTVNLPPSPDSPTLCEDFKKGRLRRAIESPEIRVCTGELCSVGTFDVRRRCRVRAYASMFLTLYIIYYVDLVYGGGVVPAAGVGVDRDSDRADGEVFGDVGEGSAGVSEDEGVSSVFSGGGGDVEEDWVEEGTLKK